MYLRISTRSPCTIHLFLPRAFKIVKPGHLLQSGHTCAPPSRMRGPTVSRDDETHKSSLQASFQRAPILGFLSACHRPLGSTSRSGNHSWKEPEFATMKRRSFRTSSPKVTLIWRCTQRVVCTASVWTSRQTQGQALSENHVFAYSLVCRVKGSQLWAI